jgi:hypothetical protein
VQIILRAIGDGVHNEVEPAPCLLDRLEHGLHLAVDLHVKGQEQRCGELVHHGRDEAFRFLSGIGDHKLGPCGAECQGASGGDRMLVRNADDKPTLAHQKSFQHQLFLLKFSETHHFVRCS